jgi:transposase InsO family protein
MSQRQRDDMVILTHIREQHGLSLESCGRPRMTEELQELGVSVGHRRVGRLMRQNGIKVIRSQKYNVTTDSNPPLPQRQPDVDGPTYHRMLCFI